MNKKSFELKNTSCEMALLTDNEASKSYLVVAAAQGKQIGYCSFSFVDEDVCKLHRIAVTDRDYIGEGVGNAMFKCMEQFCYEKDIREITCYFIPRGYRDCYELAEKFYAKQGMRACDGSQDFFERDEIYKFARDQGEQYHIDLTTDAELYKRLENYNYQQNDFFSYKYKEEALEM